ncbi:MAG: hypothetical protein OEZ39_19795 [Gammaproteobacteria bacterium]|nr:hypothetical protein [Gammaproteobacteria bacterium]MDH5654111.1 hypothetical protein [Gammaproteobacteria bacterium]
MIRRFCITVFLFCQAAVCQAGTPNADYVWHSDSKMQAEMEIPETTLSLMCNKQIFVILEKQTVTYSEIDKQRYADFKVPADAVTAISGWWAGYGQTIYVIRSGQELKIYYTEYGEEENPSPLTFTLLKTLTLKSE